MINLNNTWCEATEENYNALIARGIETHFKFNRKFTWLCVDSHGDMWGCRAYANKQIHLINGQFEYVKKSPSKDIESLIKKLESGDYIYVCKSSEHDWKQSDIINFKIHSRKDKLIHKKHKHILDAYLDGKAVSEGTERACGIFYRLGGHNFIEDYKEDCDYMVSEKQYQKLCGEESNDSNNTNTSSDNGNSDSDVVECQFTKYGFEKPEFECEIFAEKDNMLIGYAREGGTGSNVETMWQKDGCSVFTEGEFDLTPLKKEWHDVLDWSKGVAIIDTDTNKFHGVAYHRYKNTVETYRGEVLCQDITCDEWRLATKEEVLNLYKEVK